MNTRRMRPLGIMLLVILLLIVIIALAAFIAIRRPFPTTNGTVPVPGLEADVQVYRDSYGIPHIYASTAHDLFMAQGFIHAQDRFWQMEFWRRAGAGALSELLGESALGSDIFIRTVGWHRTAQKEFDSIEPELLTVLEAYAEGVNAYIDTHRGRLGLEFTVLALTGQSSEIKPWTPLNTLTWAKMMAWDLGGNMQDELTRANIVARVGSPHLSTLMPPYNPNHPVIVPQPMLSASAKSVPSEAYDLHFFGEGKDIGSNSWVLSPDRSQTGSAILANDPHLGIQMPSIWYEIGLHCDPVGPECPFNVVGASFASAPGVIIGHNEQIAWGVTNLGPDVQDLFVERINPENPNQYEFKGEWHDMQIIREVINVAGEDEPVVVHARLTHHGPIINDVVGGEEAAWAFGWEPLALSWTALEPSQLIQSVLLLDQAKNWEDFRTALSFWDVPSQNVVYADVEGNIGYQSPGKIPIRASGDGSIPVPGWNGDYEWQGYIPFEALPRSFNPPEGYIITANNAVVDSDYPYFITNDWSPGYRASRIQQLLTAQETFSLEDMQRIQGDTTAFDVEQLLPVFLALEPEEARLKQAIDLLREWNGQSIRSSRGAALFEALRLQSIDHIFGDELGEQLLQRSRWNLNIALAKILPEEESPWYDDLDTPDTESREAILLQALDAAVEQLTDQLGKDMNDWRWGDLHTATFRNQTLGESGIGLIERIFNRGPVAVDGTLASINNTSYSMGTPFTVSTVPSYRQIIHLGDFSASVSMHTTGQSGHAFHPHYNDMIDPWRNIEYHPMLWEKTNVEDAAIDILILVP